RPQRRRGAPLFADHASELAGADIQLDERRALVLRFDHPHVVAAIRQRARHDLDDVPRGAHFAAAAVSAAGTALTVRCRAISVRTVSDGCAPFFSQKSTRSLSTWTTAGFVRGL